MNAQALHPDDLAALERAAFALERDSFAMRLAEYAGQPVERALKALPPGAAARLNQAVEQAVRQALAAAIGTLNLDPARPPRRRLSTALAGLSGGVSGVFGAVALPVELPIITTLMLRAIADIARHQGEDLSTLDGRLACLQVFALGSGGGGTGGHIGYYASRALVGKLSQDAALFLVERSATALAAPAVNSLVAEIATRFGVVLADRLAMGAVPVLGAVGGATINAVFMDHYQRIADGHFTLRRLERRYGLTTVQADYTRITTTQLKLAAPASP